MSKETRKSLAFIRYSDLTALCERLEKMEAEGWRLTSLHLLAEYRRCEPRKVRYAAELLGTANIIGNQITQKSLDYIDLCEQAGWSLVSHYGPLHIFRAEDIGAPEIVSDPVEKLHAVKRASLRMYLPLWIIGVFYLLYQLFVFGAIESPSILATTQGFLLSLLSPIILIALAGMYSVEFLIWYVKAKRAVSEGLPIPFNDTKSANRATLRERIIIGLILATPFLLYLPDALRGDYVALISPFMGLAFVVALLAIIHFFYKRDRSPAKTILSAVIFSTSLVTVFAILTVALIVLFADIGRDKTPVVEIKTDSRGNFLPSPDSIPVTLADVNPAAGECENEADGESSIIAGLYTYSSGSTKDDKDYGYLSYEIYHSHFGFLLHSYVRDLGKNDPDIEYVRTEIDATPWGANEAYIARDERFGDTAYILIYDDNVLVIKTYERFTDPALIDKYAEVFGGILGN